MMQPDHMMQPDQLMATYLDIVHRYTPDQAVIGLTTITGTYVHTRWYQKRLIDRLIDDAISIQQRANVYVRITPLHKPPSQGRGTEKHALGSSVLYADIDSYGDPLDGMKLLNSYKLPPTLITSTGLGLHAYWLLDRFYTDILELKSCNKYLATLLNEQDSTKIVDNTNKIVDSCFDMARVLRLPGTWNIKRDTPIQCTIISYNPNSIYSLDQFARAPVDDDSTIVCWDSETLPETFLETIQDKDRKLAKRIKSEESAKKVDAVINSDGSVDRSRNDAYIATRLLALGYSPGIAMAVLQSPDWFSGSKYREKYRYDYVVMTVNAAIKAYNNSADRYFMKSTFIPERIGEELHTSNVFIYTAERLWHYNNGVYVGNADEYVKLEVIKRLGKRWSSKASDETIRWLTDQSRVPIDQLNLHEGLINCQNGMIEIESGQLKPHDPKYRSTVQIPAMYNPNVDTTNLDAFIAAILPHDAIDFFWQYVGSAFIRDRYWPKAYIALVGPSDSGKSKILEWLTHFFGGRSSVVALSLQTLADNKFAAANLFGMMANIFSDLDESEAQNTGMLKTLTGDDEISGEQKFKGHFMFKSTARLFFSANNYPAVKNPDEPFFNRTNVIPCKNIFVQGKNADPMIVQKMLTAQNMSAGLLRAIQGLKQLLDQGKFSYSASIEQANLDYRFSADTVSGFLHACEFDANCYIPKQEFYQIYRAACISGGRKPVSEDKFFKRVSENLQRFGMSEEYKTINDGQRVHCYGGLRPKQALEAISMPFIRVNKI